MKNCDVVSQNQSDVKRTGSGITIQRVIKGLVFLVLISVGLVGLHLVLHAVRNANGKAEISATNPPPVAVAWKSVDAHLAQEKARRHFGGLLPPQIISTIVTNVRGHFSVYVEDLKTGVWWGINEKESYNAWSLLKVSTLVVLLKKAEREQLSLDEEITMTPDEQKRESPLVQHRPGGTNKVSVKELAERMIEDSDDAAAIALCKLVSFDEFQEGLRATEMPPATPPNQLPRISPEQYANLLRSLYFSEYLAKPSSELALSLMSSSGYNDQIRAGVPKEVSVSHKVGFDGGSGDSHDCGIVFLPNRPYVLCIMSRNTTKDESERVMSSVSRQVYEFMDSGMPVSFNF